MKHILMSAVASCLMLTPALAQHKTQVVLLGVFHFDNPGMDVAKFDNANIMSEKRQQEVQQVVAQLKAYKPDKIFIEVPPSSQARIDSAVAEYKAGRYTLKASEIHQLGFRLAKELNLPTLYGVDYRGAEFPYDSLMKSMQDANQQAMMAQMQQTISGVEKYFNEAFKTKTVAQILLEQNNAASNNMQVSMYFDMLPAGKQGNHVGSYLTSEWWRRNMIIYEEMMKRLSGKEERILVIFGSGHTALLDAMMRYNDKLEIVPVANVLKP